MAGNGKAMLKRKLGPAVYWSRRAGKQSTPQEILSLAYYPSEDVRYTSKYKRQRRRKNATTKVPVSRACQLVVAPRERRKSVSVEDQYRTRETSFRPTTQQRRPQ